MSIEDLSQVNPQLYKWLATINDKSSTDNIIPQDKDIVKGSIRSAAENDTTPKRIIATNVPQMPEASEVDDGVDAKVIEMLERATGRKIVPKADEPGVGGEYSGGVVHYNPEANDAVEKSIVHELVHSVRGTPAYESLVKAAEALTEERRIREEERAAHARAKGESYKEVDYSFEGVKARAWDEEAPIYRRRGQTFDDRLAAEEAVCKILESLVNKPDDLRAFAERLNRNTLIRMRDRIATVYKRIKADIGHFFGSRLNQNYDSAKYEAELMLRKYEDALRALESALRKNKKNTANSTAQKPLYASALSAYDTTEGRESVYEEYNKPITEDDVAALRSIGRKSINNLTAEDIEKLQKWAYKFYKEIGVKSPFFRTWFGDWRAYDTETRRKYLPLNTERITPQDVSRVGAVNEDTGWNIEVSGKGIEETAHKMKKWSASYHSLKNINEMLEGAILLDSIIVNKPSKRMGPKAVIVHHFYCPVSVNSEKGIAKLYVTENYENEKTFYLTKIEMVSTDSRWDGDDASRQNSSVDTTISIADIFDFVKSHSVDFEKDSENPILFNPHAVNEAMLNSDGTPKVVYHGTDKHFTVFKSSGGAYRFSESYDYAESMAEERSGNIVMPVYLSMKNPYHAKLPEGKFSDPVAEKSIIDKARAGNYDGVIIECDTNNELVYDKFYVVFDSTQIKSAADNIGTFDGTNPDIRYSSTRGTDYGTRAKTDAERYSKVIAEQMLSQGDDVQKVYDATGWFVDEAGRMVVDVYKAVCEKVKLHFYKSFFCSILSNLLTLAEKCATLIGCVWYININRICREFRKE